MGTGVRAICLMVVMISLPTGIASANEYLTSEQALKIAFPDADSIEKKRVAVTTEHREKLRNRYGLKRASRTFRYFVGVRNGEIMGYSVIDNILGERKPFTFMVVVAPDGTVKSVEIMAYRESYGGEIRQPRFLGQFRGKKESDPLRLKTDVQSVSGATISSRAVTNGVRIILAYLSVIVPLTSGQPEEGSDQDLSR